MSPESHTTTIETPAKSSIEIIFVTHSEENLPRVAEAVLASDGDIIAIEKIREGTFGMGTSAQKAELSARMTDFLATDSEITASAAGYFQTDEPFFTAILDALRGTGKQIVLIDMGTDDPGYGLRQKSRAAAESIESLNDGTLEDTDENREMLDNMMVGYQIASAQEDEYRDHVMRSQLLQLAADNPGKKITAMIGATHTWVSHHMPDDVTTSRVFVPTVEEAARYAPPVKIIYDEYPYNGTRLLRFNLKNIGLSMLDDNGNLKESPEEEA